MKERSSATLLASVILISVALACALSTALPAQIRLASLSKETGRNLLLSVEAERDLVKQTADLGAVDGMSTKQEYKVDGFTLEENSEVLAELHELLAAEGVS